MSVYLNIYVIITLMAREMVQQLAVLAAFPRDPGSILSTHMVVHNHL